MAATTQVRLLVWSKVMVPAMLQLSSHVMHGHTSPGASGDFTLVRLLGKRRLPVPCGPTTSTLRRVVVRGFRSCGSAIVTACRACPTQDCRTPYSEEGEEDNLTRGVVRTVFLLVFSREEQGSAIRAFGSHPKNKKGVEASLRTLIPPIENVKA